MTFGAEIQFLDEVFWLWVIPWRDRFHPVYGQGNMVGMEPDPPFQIGQINLGIIATKRHEEPRPLNAT